MRIAYIGNFRYPYTTETHIARTFETLGVSVIRLQEDRTRIEEIAAVKDQGVSLVLYTRTWSYGPQLTDVWRDLEAAGIITASYHLDLYLGLNREAGLGDDPFWTTQHVFTPDGDPESAVQFERLGINHHWMPPAIVEDESYVGTAIASFAQDVAFVGMADRYHTEWPYRMELINWLRGTYGSRFWRVGHGGDHGIVRGPHLNDLYASVKVVVGDSLCPGFAKSGYWTDRPYETVGRGGFLIMPRVPGLEEHFTDGEHLRFYDYDDFDMLKNLIDEYLDDPRERDRIRRSGQAHVAANHTYRQRLTKTLEILELQP